MAASAQRVPLTAYMTAWDREQHGSEDGLRSEHHQTRFPGDTEGVRAGRGRFPDVSVERFAGQGSPNRDGFKTKQLINFDSKSHGAELGGRFS